MTHVGFVGLGSQGGPMARRTVDAGYPTTLWARRAATLEPFAETGAAIAATRAKRFAVRMAGGCSPTLARVGNTDSPF